MRNSFAITRHLAVYLAVTLGAGLGCAPGLEFDAPATVHPRSADDDSPPRPTVQLRYRWFSPDVTIVAWTPDQPWYGLRSTVRQDGSLVGDHRIFVSFYYDPGIPFAGKAVLDTRLLRLAGTSGDIERCSFGDCSPPRYFSARIPDSLLRSRQDSVNVTFYGDEGREMVVALQPELVTTYLATVDSVQATLRQRY